jgi:hypothetical protein
MCAKIHSPLFSCLTHESKGILFGGSMKIIMRNDIMSNVLFELEDGTKIWYTDMVVGSEMRKQADILLLS